MAKQTKRVAGHRKVGSDEVDTAACEKCGTVSQFPQGTPEDELFCPVCSGQVQPGAVPVTEEDVERVEKMRSTADRDVRSSDGARGKDERA